MAIKLLSQAIESFADLVFWLALFYAVFKYRIFDSLPKTPRTIIWAAIAVSAVAGIIHQYL